MLIFHNGMHQPKTNYKAPLLLSCLQQTIHYFVGLHFFLLEVLFMENGVTLASLLCCHHHADLIIYISLNIILINPPAKPSQILNDQPSILCFSYVTRELRTAALSSLLNNFIDTLLSWQHHPYADYNKSHTKASASPSPSLLLGFSCMHSTSTHICHAI